MKKPATRSPMRATRPWPAGAQITAWPGVSGRSTAWCAACPRATVWHHAGRLSCTRLRLPAPAPDSLAGRPLPWPTEPWPEGAWPGLGHSRPTPAPARRTQPGAGGAADFLHDRSRHYRGGISSPLSGAHACSRLSPYLSPGLPWHARGGAGHPAAPAATARQRRARCGLAAPGSGSLHEPHALALPLHPEARIRARAGVCATCTAATTACARATGTRPTLPRWWPGAPAGRWWTPAWPCCARRAGSTFACAPCWCRWRPTRCGCTGALWASGWRASFWTTSPASTGARCRCSPAPPASTPPASTTRSSRRKTTTRTATLCAAGCRSCAACRRPRRAPQMLAASSPGACRRKAAWAAAAAGVLPCPADHHPLGFCAGGATPPALPARHAGRSGRCFACAWQPPA
jgi:hypothetical protein